MDAPLSTPYFTLIKWIVFFEFFTIIATGIYGLLFRKIHELLHKRQQIAQDRFRKNLTESVVKKKIPSFTSGRTLSHLLPVIDGMNAEIKDPFWNEIKLHLSVGNLFPQARKLTFSRSWTKRMQALRCFLLFPDNSNERYLLHLLKDSTPVIKYTAAYSAAKLGTQESTYAIIDEMDRADHFLRHPFLDAILKGDSRAFGYIEALLEKTDNPYTKVSCLEILSHQMNAHVEELAQRDLYAPQLNLRLAAVRALGQYHHRESQDSIILLLKDPSWEVRAVAVSALGDIKRQGVVSHIEPLLRDKTWWVRLNAGLALKRMGEAGERALKDQDPAVDRFAYEMAQYVLPLTLDIKEAQDE